MSGDFLHPLMCSQGGIPYNREHIEYWQAKAAKYAGEIASLEAQLELSRIQVERARAVFDEISDLGTDGTNPAKLGNIAHAAWIELSSTEGYRG
jgi:hypothetical protein